MKKICKPSFMHKWIRIYTGGGDKTGIKSCSVCNAMQFPVKRNYDVD